MTNILKHTTALLAAIFVVSGMLTATLDVPPMHEIASADFAPLA